MVKVNKTETGVYILYSIKANIWDLANYEEVFFLLKQMYRDAFESFHSVEISLNFYEFSRNYFTVVC